ncbi:MAG: aminoglycoside phosphotransferase family protein [Planctomycetota bacterium]
MNRDDGDEAQIESAEVPFGAALEGPLIEACGGRLSKINWFRTAWQRGGALTGYAAFTDDAGRAHDVVVKLPVPPRERRWLVQLQPKARPSLERSDESFGFARTANGRGGFVPRLLAHGEAVGGYDFAWVVMERLPFGPLDEKWGGREFDLIIHAAGRFYEATADEPIDPSWGVRKRDWSAMLAEGRKRVQARGCAEPQRWKAALKRAHKKLDQWVELWDARVGDGWCHGDLHLGNTLTRVAYDDTAVADEGHHEAAALIDFAEVRVGHWVEDAVYLEHLFWSLPHRLHGRKLVSMVARERKARGLTVGEDWPELARVKRALLAMATATKFHEVGRGHAAAALEVLEREV